MPGSAAVEGRRFAVCVRVVAKYLGQAFLMLAVGEPVINAINYTLTAVSTGGFANYNDSLAGIASWPARVLIALLSLAGAVSFSLYTWAPSVTCRGCCAIRSLADRSCCVP
jgi:trk system potassium uptake protein TrkH